MQANELALKFNIEAIFSDKVEILVRPNNIVRHLEKAMQSYQSILKAYAEKTHPNEGEDLFVAEYLNCLTSYYITMNYASNKKFSQAFLLSTRALRTNEECLRIVETKLGGADHVNTSRPALAEKVKHMAQLMESLEKVKVRCHAKMLLQKAEAHRAVQESL